jgi:hypothetical protein
MKTLFYLSLMVGLAAQAQEEVTSSLPAPEQTESITLPQSAKLSFQGKVKKKVKSIAMAQIKQDKGNLNLVFDSEHLQPGQYQLSFAESCQAVDKTRIVLGEFKTQSGFISTEFNHSESTLKKNPFNLEVPQFLLLTKKEKNGKKNSTISCVEIKTAPEAPSQASLE